MLSTVHRVCTGRRRVYPSPVSTAAQSWRERERERERGRDWSVCFLVGGGGGFDWVLILLFDNLGEVWEGREFYCFTGSSIRVLERERERVE